MQLYTVHLFLENYSTCFGSYLHPSSGAHTTVFTAFGTCQTVTATNRYRGRFGTGLSLVWELMRLLMYVSNHSKTYQLFH